MARPNPMPQAPSPSAQVGHGGSLQQPLLATLNVVLIFSLCYFLWRIFCNKRSTSPALAATVVVVAAASPPAKNETSGPDAAQDVLSSLPTFVHNGAAGDRCTVCLTEFAEGEVGRLFPACHHRFHTECIDVWLASNSSCPNCRCTIEVDKMYPFVSLSLSSSP